MALSTPALLATGTLATNGTSVVSASSSPSDNALLVVAVSTISSSTPGTFAISTTLSNVGTWTQITVVSALNATRQIRTSIFYAQVTGDPGTGTVTATFTTAARGAIAVHEVASGYNTTTPIRQSNSNTGTTSTLAVTLSSSPLSDSTTLGAVGGHDNSDGTTPGANFTELADVTAGASEHLGMETEYDATSPTTTVDWSALGTSNNAGIGVEIAATPVVSDEGAFFQMF